MKTYQIVEKKRITRIRQRNPRLEICQLAVLVVAHGSPHAEWNERVEQVVRQAALPVPVFVAYLSHVPEQSILKQLARLQQTGMKKVIVVPLFVSEGSTHVQDIREMIQSLATSTEFLWCSPLERDEQIVRLWEERLAEMVQQPSREVLLVIGHGSDIPGFREKWQDLLQYAANRMQQCFGLRYATYATLLPDTVMETAAQFVNLGRLLVLPLFISEGYFTQQSIPAKLNGLSYVYTGKTYLPHPRIAEWIHATVYDQIEQSANIKFIDRMRGVNLAASCFEQSI